MSVPHPTDPGESGNDVRSALRAELTERRKARDSTGVEAIRLALAAVGNAEAQPVGTETQTERLLGASASSDVARREVSDAEARAMVADEAEALRRAAADYETLGQAEAAARVAHQAAVLEAVLEAMLRGRPEHG